MYIYFNAFWGDDFFNISLKCLHIGFFLDLFEKVFNEKCQIGTYENSSILCESLFGDSALLNKKWNYTILYSGESRLREDSNLYSVILYSKYSHKNIVNCPLFLGYLYASNRLGDFELSHTIIRYDIPKNDIIVYISNTSEGYTKRLEFIELLDKEYNVVYAGKYKNNIGGPSKIYYYSSNNEFINFNKNFKFIIAMENSIEETYITEKICHGIDAKIIPIYWGTTNIVNYFNKERFVMVNDNNYNETLIQLRDLYTNNDKWLTMVNQPTFVDNKLSLSINNIATDIKHLINIQ
jgi:hypothetical protein